jgi:hypothetical protein
MSVYENCQNATLVLLQALTDQFPNAWQVVAYDFGVLDKGLPPDAPNAAVLTPGQFSENALRPEVANDTEDVMIDMFTTYNTEAVSFATFTALREAIRAHLRKYPTLNGVDGIRNITMSSTGDPAAIDHRNLNMATPSTPTHIVQTLRLTIEWQGRITGGEHG